MSTFGSPARNCVTGLVRGAACKRVCSVLLRRQELSGQPLTFSRQRLQRTGERDIWAGSQPQLPTLEYVHTHPRTSHLLTPQLRSFAPSSAAGSERSTGSYPLSSSQQAARSARRGWPNRQPDEYQDTVLQTPWLSSPLPSAYSAEPMSLAGEPSSRSAYANWQGGWQTSSLRRTSSEDTRLIHYYGSEGSSNATNLQAKSHPQRRPSNRDEFDGPSQLLDKPEDSSYEPREEDLPQLPITLYAQEQDEILSKVNDRLAQCAFDFVAKYQFPIPVEPDKRPVRVPGDREWSEWVYLLKRLATKRRIPARVLYNGQIKQLITILENSLEMRHAAKHQSRPLKDDRNILQLISSGLQVAKILKDAPAMQYLDGLYIQTERVVQNRRQHVSSLTYSS